MYDPFYEPYDYAHPTKAELDREAAEDARSRFRRTHEFELPVGPEDFAPVVPEHHNE